MSLGGQTDKSSYLPPIETESGDYDYEQQESQPKIKVPKKTKITHQKK